MKSLKEQAEQVFLKYVERHCEQVNFNAVKLEVFKAMFSKDSKQFIEWILTYSKEKLTEKQYLDIELKMCQIVARNIKIEVPGTKHILNRLIEKNSNGLWQTEYERKIVLKDIYDYCMLVEWKTKFLDYLADVLKIYRHNVREMAKDYAKENFSEEEYIIINKKIKELTNRNHKLEMTSINVILKKLTGKITDMLWETEEEKQIMLNYIYNYCEDNLYNDDKIEELSDWTGISENKIRTFAKEYAITYLGINLEEYNQKKYQYGKTKAEITREKSGFQRYKKIYEALLKTQTKDEIITLIDSQNVNVSSLASGAFNYVIVYHGGNNQILDKLKSMIKIYSNYMSQKFKEQQEIQKITEVEEKTNQEIKKLPMIIDIVMRFINSFEFNTIGEFCKENNIDKRIFEEYILILKEHKPDVYDLYNKKISNMNKQRYAIIITQLNCIIEGLKYGIEENNLKRTFDIVDYYNITNISFEKLLVIAKEVLVPNDFIILKKFLNQNINNEKQNPSIIRQIMEEKVIIQYEKDKKGQPIAGTEILFSNQEKQKLINYLNDNKIPINLKTYNIVYRRYRNGILDLEKTAKLK